MTYNGLQVDREAQVSDVMTLWGLGTDEIVGNLLDTMNGAAGGRMCFGYNRSIVPNIPPLISNGRGNDVRALVARALVARAVHGDSLKQTHVASPNPVPNDDVRLHYITRLPESFLDKAYTPERKKSIRVQEGILKKAVDVINGIGYVSHSCHLRAKHGREFGYRMESEDEQRQRRMLWREMERAIY